MPYDPSVIEPRWQKYWEENRTFRVEVDPARPKYYILDMFPYPSGAGLHVGHPEGYTATDILARWRRMRGFNVLHPMGWDAFGLPAENHALRTGTHPAVETRKNIATFRRQIRMLGFSYDWDREIDTTDPGYYRWTQWIFKRLHEKGLAYESEAPINFCPSCAVGLANEEVEDGACARCGAAVTKRVLRQWMLRITAYADRLLQDLDLVEWPESTREMQRNWIGRSEGAEIDFAVPGSDAAIRVFTTRPDTLYGATFLVLAPEHPLVEKLTTDACRAAVQAYRAEAAARSDMERSRAEREKTGVPTGGFARNPASGALTPVWIADYVLMGYGTGAIMAVPGHDERDWTFARRYDLPIVEVVKGGDVSAAAFTDETTGIAVNSPVIDGLRTPEARSRMISWLETQGHGRRAVRYKLRDWVFSRQRYWGEPFPVLHRPDGTVELVPDGDLPVLLPDVTRYEPTGTGEGPLALISDWIDVRDPVTGAVLRRESNTMPQWAGSCWYYLRFIDPHNAESLVDPAKERYWMPVDLYVGGAEHAVLHLLYARFWHKVLFDLGVVSTPEPFRRLVHQGMILGEDGEKMSKSRGNVVNPDDVVRENGADTMRLYEMFMGPLEKAKPWSTAGIEGVRRFVERAWRLVLDEDDRLHPAISDAAPDDAQLRILHRTIDKVTRDIEGLRFNTGISQMMIFVNEMMKAEVRPRALLEAFVKILAPFAPHIAEELWHRLGHARTLAYEPWPEADARWLADETVEIAIQVNGKIRDRITVAADIAAPDIERLALERPKIAEALAGRAPRAVRYVPGRLVAVSV